jgi:hypothetical protein
VASGRINRNFTVSVTLTQSGQSRTLSATGKILAPS